MKKFNVLPALLITTLIFSLSLSAGMVFAQENETETPKPTSIKLTTTVKISQSPKAKETEAETEGVKKEGLLNRCKEVSDKVDNINTGFTKGRDDNQYKYNNTVTQLKKISQRFKDKGLDTSALDSEITVLGTKIEKYVTDMNKLINGMKAIKAVQCATLSITPKPSGTPKISETQKVLNDAKMTARRQILSDIKSDVQDIRNYFKTVIKPAIQDLIALLPKSTKTETPATETPTVTP